MRMERFFDGFDLTPAQEAQGMSLEQKIAHSIDLLRIHEPSDGYYLAFSGGKDSIVCKELLTMSGCKFDGHYNNTTIDPPELVRFIKNYHPEEWANRNESPQGNMLHRIATAGKVPPTRASRWCCEEYKEYGGNDRVKVMGVRAEESSKRARRWKEVASDKDGSPVICVILFWTVKNDIWPFIRQRNIPYCSLYDEGWTRLGCVGCPLNPGSQKREFERWPKFEQNWKKAIIANWEKWHDVPREDGLPRYHAKFSSGEEFWQWWLTAKRVLVVCQEGLLWTNDDE